MDHTQRELQAVYEQKAREHSITLPPAPAAAPPPDPAEFELVAAEPQLTIRSWIAAAGRCWDIAFVGDVAPTADELIEVLHAISGHDCHCFMAGRPIPDDALGAG